MSTITLERNICDTNEYHLFGIPGSSDRQDAWVINVSQPAQFEYYDIVADWGARPAVQPDPSEAFQTMLASEEVLRRDWDDPEEDELWVDL
jgi:hypothetical protein